MSDSTATKRPAGGPALLVAALLLLTTTPAPIRAQNARPGPDREPGARLAALAANAAVGGVTAGLLRVLAGGSFLDAVPTGAAGGSLAYAAKEVTARDFWGAGLVGRQLASLGGGIVADAGAGRGLLSTVVLPVGPLRIHARGPAVHGRVTVDPVGLGMTVSALADDRFRLDPGRSLSAGTATFTASRLLHLDDGTIATGGEVNGVILLGGSGGGRYALAPAIQRVNFAHERVHVLQHDFTFAAWSAPLQRWLATESGAVRKVGRFLEINLVYLPLTAISTAFRGKAARPWEIEAGVLQDLAW